MSHTRYSVQAVIHRKRVLKPVLPLLPSIIAQSRLNHTDHKPLAKTMKREEPFEVVKLPEIIVTPRPHLNPPTIVVTPRDSKASVAELKPPPPKKLPPPTMLVVQWCAGGRSYRRTFDYTVEGAEIAAEFCTKLRVIWKEDESFAIRMSHQDMKGNLLNMVKSVDRVFEDSSD